MRKQVGIVHLVYSIIISLIVITFISILAFGASSDAGNQMNVAATAISIILAVIAILMTLVDVAGQRQAMIDLKDTAESLSESNKRAQEMIGKAIETVEGFESSKKAMLDTVSQVKDETIQSVKEFSKIGGGIDTQKLDTFLNELESKLDMNIDKIKNQKTLNKAEHELSVYLSFIDWLENNYAKNPKKLYYKPFYDKLKFRFGSRDARRLMHFLVKNNLVQFTPDNRDIIELSPELFN
ncbi:hypothetical protein [Bacillus haynesii]|uniref:hypothetical protein n=1 Tax=Bacillus haynesii TaxID=1925021 RepID=UPI001F6056BF|nr:hypothetical protein [Bacillus haynesii]MCI4129755.1 hypothetical protein [Bacillus haynesii]